MIKFCENSYGIISKKKTLTKKKNSNISDEKDVSPFHLDEDRADAEVGEIWERLKNQLEDVHAASLSGKARKRYNREKIVKLGAAPPKPIQIPTDMRIGMLKKNREREHKERMAAREAELVVSKRVFDINKARKTRNEIKKRRKAINVTRTPNAESIREMISN